MSSIHSTLPPIALRNDTLRVLLEQLILLESDGRAIVIDLDGDCGGRLLPRHREQSSRQETINFLLLEIDAARLDVLLLKNPTYGAIWHQLCCAHLVRLEEQSRVHLRKLEDQNVAKLLDDVEHRASQEAMASETAKVRREAEKLMTEALAQSERNAADAQRNAADAQRIAKAQKDIAEQQQENARTGLAAQRAKERASAKLKRARWMLAASVLTLLAVVALRYLPSTLERPASSPREAGLLCLPTSNLQLALVSPVPSVPSSDLLIAPTQTVPVTLPTVPSGPITPKKLGPLRPPPPLRGPSQPNRGRGSSGSPGMPPESWIHEPQHQLNWLWTPPSVRAAP